jgi:predicted nucleic acid-binding protein
VAVLIDTNVLVYRYDGRFPQKQSAATGLLRQGIASGEAVLPYQALVEFVAATTRPLTPGGASLLTREEAWQEAEELLSQFRVLYPSEGLFRLAVRGAAAYRLGWFDALIWAYAEHHGIPEIWSEDFSANALIGTMRIVDPFAAEALRRPSP